MKKFSSNQFGARTWFLLAVCPALSAAEIQTNQPPPAAVVKINFDADIRPIFEASCIRCHGPVKPRSGFRLVSREAALKGGDENTGDIVPGDSSRSWLLKYVERQVPDLEMPPAGKGEPLTARQISLLRDWINQGASWATTNPPPQTALTFAPTLRWIGVQGNSSKFRELEGVPEGVAGGAEDFAVTEQIAPDEKLSVSGHFIVPEQDLELKLALDKTDVGFVHAGFTEWRKYYSDTGGYNPTVTPSEFNLNRDLYVDNGRAWIDFGLALPRRPQLVLGYEYDFRNGSQSMLDWGYANGKDIYPATLAVDEETHIIKLEVTHDYNDWHLADKARVEFNGEKNNSSEPGVFFGGAAPDTFVNTRDNYHSTQGMNTLSVEKQMRDWWFVSGGFYYSKLEGSDFFNQTTAIPAFDFNNTLSSSQITLRRESEIFSAASLFTPLEQLTFSIGSQNEWTTQDGFGNSIPDLDLGANAPAGSNLNLFKASQAANVRFTKIPFTVLFADARLDEEGVNQFQHQDPDAVLNQNDALNHRYDVQTGFNTSPWRWAAWSAQYELQASDTDYNNPTDVVNGNPGGTNGYPGFIRSRSIASDKFETKLELRPAAWLKATLTCQITDTDYSSRTAPAFDYAQLQTVSPGGPITDGHYHAQTYALGVTLTPIPRFYFTGAFTYSQSRATTASNGDPSIVPYDGNIYTLITTASYALNAKTRLQTSYAFSEADYAQNNAAAGMPLGLNFTRNELLVGLTRQLSKHLTGVLRYQFSQYAEPSSGNANNFTAQGVFATFVYQWP